MNNQTTSDSTMTKFDNMIDNMTDEQFDTFMAICFDGDELNDVDIHADLSGDDYADAVLKELGY